MGEGSEVGKLDHKGLKDQAEDLGTMESHGRYVSRGEARFMSYKDPLGIGMGFPWGLSLDAKHLGRGP